MMIWQYYSGFYVQQLHAPNDAKIVTAPSTLDKATQEFEKLTFDNKISKEQMANFELGEHCLFIKFK